MKKKEHKDMKKKGLRVKTGILALILLLTQGFLTGCSDGLENDLDEETEAYQLSLVAEYAAGLLLKYDKHGLNGLTLTGPEQPAREDPLDVSAPTPEEAEPMEDAPAPEPSADAGAVPPEQIAGSIAEALGIPEFNVNFTYYEIRDTYPDEPSMENMLFSLQAEEGQDLLILHFDLVNPTGGDLPCSPMSNDRKIRLILNGSKRINQQITILLNDLKSYDGVLTAGQVVDTVLVFYLDEGSEAIDSLELVIVGTEGEQRFSLPVISGGSGQAPAPEAYPPEEMPQEMPEEELPAEAVAE